MIFPFTLTAHIEKKNNPGFHNIIKLTCGHFVHVILVRYEKVRVMVCDRIDALQQRYLHNLQTK